MKKWFATILVVLILAPMVSRSLIYLHYKINQEFIASTLCISRDQPITICYGSCYLRLQLKKVPDTEEGTFPTKPQKQPDHSSYIVCKTGYQIAPETASSKIYGRHIEKLSGILINSGVFHPPKSI